MRCSISGSCVTHESGISSGRAVCVMASTGKTAPMTGPHQRLCMTVTAMLGRSGRAVPVVLWRPAQIPRPWRVCKCRGSAWRWRGPRHAGQAVEKRESGTGSFGATGAHLSSRQLAGSVRSDRNVREPHKIRVRDGSVDESLHVYPFWHVESQQRRPTEQVVLFPMPHAIVPLLRCDEQAMAGGPLCIPPGRCAHVHVWFAGQVCLRLLTIPVLLTFGVWRGRKAGERLLPVCGCQVRARE